MQNFIKRSYEEQIRSIGRIFGSVNRTNKELAILKEHCLCTMFYFLFGNLNKYRITPTNNQTKRIFKNKFTENFLLRLQYTHTTMKGCTFLCGSDFSEWTLDNEEVRFGATLGYTSMPNEDSGCVYRTLKISNICVFDSDLFKDFRMFISVYPTGWVDRGDRGEINDFIHTGNYFDIFFIGKGPLENITLNSTWSYDLKNQRRGFLQSGNEKNEILVRPCWDLSPYWRKKTDLNSEYREIEQNFVRDFKDKNIILSSFIRYKLIFSKLLYKTTF